MKILLKKTVATVLSLVVGIACFVGSGWGAPSFAEDISYNQADGTYLYSDGTLIINELSEEHSSNVTRHGAVSASYAAYDGTNYNVVPWNLKRTGINAVEFGSPVSPTTMRQWFYRCSNLSSISLSNLNTGNVTDMTHLFSGCACLADLDLSDFDTGNVTNMSYMFNGCSSLGELELSSFDTSKVTDMQSMFACCSNLTELDLSSFDTGNVTMMYGMFYNCSSLEDITFSENFDTGKVREYGSMFEDCSLLKTLDLSWFETDSAGDAGSFDYMFSGCTNLETIYARTWEKASGGNTTADNMFTGCVNLNGYDEPQNDNPRSGFHASLDSTGYFSKIYDIVLPESLLLAADGNIGEIFPTYYSIVNNTAFDYELKNIKVTGVNDWTCVNQGDSFTLDSKLFALVAEGYPIDPSSGITPTDIILIHSKARINETDTEAETAISFEGIVSPSSTQVSEQIGVLTLEIE